MKIWCWYCAKKKEDTFFYRDNSTATGYGCLCKECQRIYQREKVRNYPETYARKHKRSDKKRIGRKREYPRDIKSAHEKIKQEVKSGKLVKGSCEICGWEKTIAHHDDYSKPLVVRWLCNSCHQMWHRQNGAGKRAIDVVSKCVPSERRA